MSRIEALIAEFCPEGVEFKAIGQLAECYSGATPASGVAAYWEGGIIPWMSSGEVNKGIVYDTDKKITQAAFDSCSTKMVPPSAVVMALAGQGKTRGTVARTRISLCTNQSLCSIICNASINSDFLYYFLSTQYQQLRDVSSGDGTRGGLNLQMIRSYRVPVPPLKVQREIVKVLDTFTKLEAELEAELEARRRQYKYYRDALLTFGERTDADASKQASITTLGEIGVIFGGLTGKSKADFTNGNARFVSYVNVFNNIATNIETDDFVKIEPNERQRTLQRGDIIFTGSSETPEEVGMSSVVTAEIHEPLYLNSFCIGYRLNDTNVLNPEFSKHLFRSEEMRQRLVRTASGVTRFNVSKARLAQVEVPLPPLEEQARIVAILDQFDALVNDLSSGLPAEIAARRQQYAHYRDRLLAFREAA